MKTRVKFSKQILSVLLCLAMLMSYVPLTAVAADAVSYIDCTWDGIKVVKTTKTVTEYTVVTSGTTTMTDGWYVVNSDVTVSKRISVNGNANLIVADDCTLTANKGIYVSSDKTLDIYGQEKGTGAIVATANNYSYSGIALDGSITIHGGNITATGGDSSGEGIGAGIGGDSVDSITIYDGVITAIGSNVYGWNGCAGIGGIGTNIVSKAGYPSGDIDIYGGIVFATGRNDADDIGGGKGNTGKGARNVTVEGGLIFDRNGSGVLGGTEYTLQKDWTIPEGKTLTVESGKTLIISKGVTLTITGTLTNNGTIVTDCDDTTAYGGNVAYTHMGMATCITSSTCTACGETYLNADNHEKPDDFNYFINTSDKTKHDVKYACCEATKETVAHSLQYSKTADNVLTETCSANCGHSATATLAIENGSYAYTGTTITPATITYSDDWQGEKPTEISYSNNVNAGTATASITAGEATAIVDFTIAKAPLTVTASDATITYGEAPTNNGVTYSGFVNGENENVLGGELAYTYTYTQNGNVGDYSITPEGLTADNYEITFVDGTLTVEQIDINDIIDEMKINLEQYSYVYDGTEKKPKVTSITVDGVTLTEGTDYTVRYEDNVYVGNYATAVINFEGNYDGTFRKWFTITKAYYDLTAPTPNTLTYNGEEQYLVSAGTVEGADFEYSLDGTSWSTSIPQAKDVGNYTVYYRVLADENHYGVEGTVAVTINECAHEWGEGVLTRPTFETDGYYTYTCTLCGEEKTETVKSADYSAYEAVSEEINALLQSDDLTSEAKQAIYSAANECGLPSNDLTESEQNKVDDLVAELEKIVADAEEKIESGEYVKADYTEIDEAIDDIEEKLASENVTDEGKAGLEEIKTQLEEMKADENTSEADLAELETALDEYEEELDKGIEDGTLVKIDGMKEYNKIAGALDAELMENYSQEEIAALAEKAGDEINARFGEIIEKAEALTGTVAENKDALAEIESEMRALYGEIKNCLDGVHNGFVYEVTEEAKCGVNAIESATCTLCGETDEREVEGTALEHIFLDYVSNGDATCTADGTKTAECIHGCGATDTVADEGSKLDHTDEDGDKLCDDCGEEVYDRCDICGGKAHGDDKIQLLFCMIITIIRVVTSILKSIN